MPPIVGTLFQIAWGNPYAEPPDGAPRVLAEYFAPGHMSAVPDAITAFPHSLGGGYGLAVTHFTPPIRRQAPQTLAGIRQKCLRRRIERKAPLFAQQFIDEALAAKPAYYLEGTTDPATEQARTDAETRYAARLASLQARSNQLIVYGSEPPAVTAAAEQLRAEMAEAGARAAQRRQARLAAEAASNGMSAKPDTPAIGDNLWLR